MCESRSDRGRAVLDSKLDFGALRRDAEWKTVSDFDSGGIAIGPAPNGRESECNALRHVARHGYSPMSGTNHQVRRQEPTKACELRGSQFEQIDGPRTHS